MKKLVVWLLVIGFLAGTLSTVFFALRGGLSVPDPWAGVPSPDIRSFKWADWAGEDVSDADFTELGTLLSTITFDLDTVWPESAMMPQDTTPDEIMEQARYLGLGLNNLHAQGINGQGISVAVMDKPLSPTHEAFAHNMTYIDVNPEMSASVTSDSHGAACAGILAGKDGVAPGARLYYFAIVDDGQPYLRLNEAMNKLLELQEELPDEGKIKVVSVSLGVQSDAVEGNVGGAADWMETVAKAEKSGIVVVYPGMAELQYTGAGCMPGKDRDDPNEYELWSWNAAKAEVVKKLDKAGANTWEKAREELIRLLTKDPNLDVLQADAIQTFIYLLSMYRGSMTYDLWKLAMANTSPEALAVPADFLTVPSVTSDNAYAYLGAGGTNWSTPYLAGLLALGLQARPDATGAEMYFALKDTASSVGVRGDTPTGQALTMLLVNPQAFIQRLRSE